VEASCKILIVGENLTGEKKEKEEYCLVADSLNCLSNYPRNGKTLYLLLIFFLSRQ